jgi:hypothetical protein
LKSLPPLLPASKITGSPPVLFELRAKRKCVIQTF